MYLIPAYKVQLVREGTVTMHDRPNITCAEEISEVFMTYLGETDREHFMIAMLDTKNKIIGVHTVSIGTLNESLIHPREVFKPAISHNAYAMIICHNHPSGDTTPSQEDLDITARLRAAGELLGIAVLDHLILGDGTYLSMAAAHLL